MNSLGLADWFARARTLDLVAVAAALDLRVSRGRFGPCPACGAVNGGGADRRPPVGISQDRQGWRCFRCDAHGDGPALVALRLLQRPADTPEDWRTVRSWYAARGVPDLEPAPTWPSTPRKAPTLPPLPPAPEVDAAPCRPPVAEVTSLWDASHSADYTGDGTPWFLDAVSYLLRRGFHPLALAALDQIRILPPPERHPWPSWWPGEWGPWRLAVRAWEPDGTLGSLHARAVDLDCTSSPKTRWPRGAESRGLLMANPGGLSLLRGEPLPGLRLVVLAEGLTDLLRVSILVADGGLPFAILSGASGSWAGLARVRWPSGVPVVASPDLDAGGEGHFEAIRRAVADTGMDLRRWRGRKS